jgi:hypothetical protein
MSPPGHIYFADTQPGWCKVGRFAAHLTADDKQRQYRRLEPAFTVAKWYPTDDAVKEEARVLAILRLVAGTTVTGAGRECFNIPAEKAYDAVKGGQPELEALARKTINAMRLGGEGPTIRELLDEYNQTETTKENFAAVMDLHSKISLGFSVIGLHPHAALPDMELDVKVFGIVLYPKKLLKVCPALKPCESVLEGLTF